MYTKFRLPVLVFALALFACRLAIAGQEFDRRATLTAQVLAGIQPASGDSTYDRLTASNAWIEHKAWMNEQWAQLSPRIKEMKAWRDREIRIESARRTTLLYPFSGPDFLNAHVLFPEHARYIFFGLERPGALPDLQRLKPAQFEHLLQDVRGAFRDILQRNYFITSHMSKQLTTSTLQGTVPVMAIMMVLTGQRIVRIEAVDSLLGPAGSAGSEKMTQVRRSLRGVRIEFSDESRTGAQELYYFALDATDKALVRHPGFLRWVATHRPATALVKSASYLLHDNQFSKTRDMLLASAGVVVQDDTGIPFRYLKQLEWQIRLYGRYNKPIKPMTWGYQPDLESAYKEQADLPVLPFPFGYHWRGEGSGLLIATRRPG